MTSKSCKINLLDVLVDIKVDDLQMLFIFSGICFHRNDSFPDGFLYAFSQLFNMRFMFTNGLKQWLSRPKNVLQDSLKKQRKII